MSTSEASADSASGAPPTAEEPGRSHEPGKSQGAGPTGTTTFDLRDLEPSHKPTRLVQWVLNNPLWVYAILRTVAPVWKLPLIDWMVVTRFDHVKEVLAQDQVFGVPWSEKMKVANGGGAIFVLGIDEPQAHQHALAQLMKVFRLEDVPAVGAMARNFAETIVAQHRGRKLDAVQDLITRVPTLICRDYYGIPIAAGQEVEFAHWAIALSTFMFGDPTNAPPYRRIALAAAERLNPLLDRAIALAKTHQAPADTIVARLVALQADDASLTDDVIRGHLIGMITGFVPTNTMAGGHMLDALVGDGRFLWWSRRTFSDPAHEAIAQQDDEALMRCLFETSRFKPINFGPMRIATKDYVIANGGFLGLFPRKIPKGTNLVASTQSGMFDGRRVRRRYRFDPDRAASDYMLFGSGMHPCLGRFLAQAQITQTFKVLLSQKNLRRAAGAEGQLARLGPFPEHLLVEYD